MKIIWCNKYNKPIEEVGDLCNLECFEEGQDSCEYLTVKIKLTKEEQEGEESSEVSI